MAPTDEGGSPIAPGSRVDIPLSVRVLFSHAAIQQVAEQKGVDILHIKGPAIDPRLQPTPRGSTDADVIVRPQHVDRFIRALKAAGWAHRASFASGSVFEHAATLWHDHWGYVDVHRRFPGISIRSSAAFDRLWRERGEVVLAEQRCAVPSVTAQALLLILHTARSAAQPDQAPDLRLTWFDASEDFRASVMRLRDEFGAQLAFAAALGHLEDYRDHPEYALWQHMRAGGSRTAQLRARLQAAPSSLAAARIMVRSALINRDHLAMRLGRRPTQREVLAEQAARARQLFRDTRRRRRS